MKKETGILSEIVEKLLELMTVKARPEVSYDKENEVFVVNLDAKDETGLLIGKKGETLGSIQLLLGIMFKQRVGEWHRVILNVGDYRQKEEDYLTNLAHSAASRAKETGEPQSLYNLKPWQRRVVHLALSEDKEIVTESTGEGEERYLVIKPAK
jgi:spoIIIJ-associated protein